MKLKTYKSKMKMQEFLEETWLGEFFEKVEKRIGKKVNIISWLSNSDECNNWSKSIYDKNFRLYFNKFNFYWDNKIQRWKLIQLGDVELERFGETFIADFNKELAEDGEETIEIGGQNENKNKI